MPIKRTTWSLKLAVLLPRKRGCQQAVPGCLSCGVILTSQNCEQELFQQPQVPLWSANCPLYSLVSSKTHLLDIPLQSRNQLFIQWTQVSLSGNEYLVNTALVLDVQFWFLNEFLFWTSIVSAPSFDFLL